MLLKIEINKEEKNASMSIEASEGVEAKWQDLQEEDQIGIINVLSGFANLFYKSYNAEHPSDKQEVTKSENND